MIVFIYLITCVFFRTRGGTPPPKYPMYPGDKKPKKSTSGQVKQPLEPVLISLLPPKSETCNTPVTDSSSGASRHSISPVIKTPIRSPAGERYASQPQTKKSPGGQVGKQFKYQ